MKKLLIILSTIFIISGALGILSACSQNEDKNSQNQTGDTPYDITTSDPAIPVNLQWDTTTWMLSWDAAENAESYVIFAEESGEFYNSTENYINLEHKLETNSTYTVLVHSANSQTVSEWSDEITIETETSTAALTYYLTDDGRGYEVSRKYANVNTGLEGRVVIADYYNDLPVISIADYAFSYSGLGERDTETGLNCNTVITSVHLPKYLENIGEDAFHYCIALTGVTFPGSVNHINEYAFAQCISLSEIVNFPDAVTEISKSLFSWTAISEFNFSDNVVSIGGSAFIKCENLTEIIIPDSVTEIGYGAFYNCVNLKDIRMSSNIEKFAAYVFYNTAWLDSQTDDFIMIGDGILYLYQGNETDITLPSEIKSIAGYAFYRNNEITSITTSSYVKLLGENIFYNCTSLKSVIIDTDDIPEETFYECTSLNNLEFSGNLKSIGYRAFFKCYSLTNLTIPESVIFIDEQAFSWDDKLVEIYNLSSLDFTIGSDEHGGIAYYAKAVYTSTQSESCIINYKEFRFYNDNGLYYLLGYTGSDTEITLPELLIDGKTVNYEIYQHAFYKDTKIESVIVHETTTTIGEYAFYYCSGLKSIKILGNISAIGEYAFYSCDALEEVIINKSVTSIGYYAFYWCKSLKEIIFPDGITEICERAFYNCSSLTSIVIPDSIETIGKGAFKSCSSLTTVYYKGTAEEWSRINSDNKVYTYLTDNIIYFYSPTEPALNEDGTAYDGNYWYYDEYGNYTIWSV